MDLGLVSLLIAFLALIITSLIEVKSYKVTTRIQSFIEHEAEIRPTMTEDLEQWLTETETIDGKEVSRLDIIGHKLGVAFASSMRFAGMQEKSVQSRVVNGYSEKIQDAVKQKMPIGYKLILEGARQVGFDLDDIMQKGELTEFLQAARENRLDLLFGNNGRMANSSGVPEM